MVNIKEYKSKWCENKEDKAHVCNTSSTRELWLYYGSNLPILYTFLPVLVEGFAQVWEKKSLKWLQRAWLASAALPVEQET